MKLDDLNVKIFADCADLEGIAELATNPMIKGFTTNPTLMRKAGVTDYERFAKAALDLVEGRPISFEVFADEFEEMERQARKIAAWGDNVYVKIPVTNTKGEASFDTIQKLSHEGVRVNVTAITTPMQGLFAAASLVEGAKSYLSVFAGRIADTGVDPTVIMAMACDVFKRVSGSEVIWASPRELLNVCQASVLGCDIITMTPELLAKLDLLGKPLDEYSLETVQMFYRDGQAAGYSL